MRESLHCKALFFLRMSGIKLNKQNPQIILDLLLDLVYSFEVSACRNCFICWFAMLYQ